MLCPLFVLCWPVPAGAARERPALAAPVLPRRQGGEGLRCASRRADCGAAEPSRASAGAERPWPAPAAADRPGLGAALATLTPLLAARGVLGLQAALLGTAFPIRT